MAARNSIRLRKHRSACRIKLEATWQRKNASRLQ